MTWPIYAMDTCFYHALGNYPWSVRSAMLRELGYDATYLTLFGEAEWAMLPDLARSQTRDGVPVAAVYAMPQADSSSDWRRVRDELLPALDGNTACELAIQAPADCAADDQALRQRVCAELTALAEHASARGLSIRLYPHLGFYIDTTAQALALLDEVDRPELGVMFCLFHWYAGDPQPLPDLLDAAGGRLRGVNLCGSRPGGPLYGHTIEPLDAGHCDPFVLCAQLQRVGYAGSIGIQGYGQGGDPYPQLQRSLACLRAIEARLAAHSEWTAFDFSPTKHLATFRGGQGAATQ